MKSCLYSLIIAFILLASCGQNKQNSITSDDINNPNSGSGKVDLSELPVFEFNEEVHDFGKLGQGEKVTYTFKFKNSGKKDLVIFDAKATCGCTVADFPKTPVKPGQEEGIAVTFSTETKKGIQNKTITLIANTQPNTKVLTIKAEIIPPLNN